MTQIERIFADLAVRKSAKIRPIRVIRVPFTHKSGTLDQHTILTSRFPISENSRYSHSFVSKTR